MAKASDPRDHADLDPNDWQLESAGRSVWSGNNAAIRLRGGDVGLKISSFLPTAEADRILEQAFSLAQPPQRFRMLPEGFPSDPACPPIGGIWELSLYPDRLVDHEGTHLPFSGPVSALADSAGNIAVTRGRNLAAKGAGTLLLGPIGLFFMGNAKERQTDTRELYLLVEGPGWAYTHQFTAELGGLLRDFAQQVNAAANLREQERKTEPLAPSASSGVADLASGLRELGDLRDAGLLTQGEFEKQKAKLLDSQL